MRTAIPLDSCTFVGVYHAGVVSELLGRGSAEVRVTGIRDCEAPFIAAARHSEERRSGLVGLVPPAGRIAHDWRQERTYAGLLVSGAAARQFYFIKVTPYNV